MINLIEDLAKFDRWQKEDLSHTMWAWINKGLPKEFEPIDVKPALDPELNRVVLKNSKEQVVALNFGELEMVYVCPNEGQHGFFDELVEEFNLLSLSDKAWLRNLATRLGKEKSIPENIGYEENQSDQGSIKTH